MSNLINGIDLQAIGALRDDIAANSEKGIVGFDVTTAWCGGTRSEATVNPWTVQGVPQPIAEKPMIIAADEPSALGGVASAPNPQELLFAALNACMTVGYVVAAASEGVTLEKLEIRTTGNLDLRGFMGLDSEVKPGYDKINYTISVKGDGTVEQFERIHQMVIATSPNRWNLANNIEVQGDQIVG